MKTKIEEILKGMPVTKIEQIGPLWQVSLGALCGARVDGEALARDLKAQWEKVEAERLRTAQPKPEHKLPQSAERVVTVDNPEQAKKIAELEAALAAASAPKPEPVSAHIPPPELADLIEINETPPETHARLTKLYSDAKQGAELARAYGGTFNGKGVVEWERKAERYESGIKWNRGRLAETI